MCYTSGECSNICEILLNGLRVKLFDYIIFIWGWSHFAPHTLHKYISSICNKYSYKTMITLTFDLQSCWFIDTVSFQMLLNCEYICSNEHIFLLKPKFKIFKIYRTHKKWMNYCWWLRHNSEISSRDISLCQFVWDGNLLTRIGMFWKL
jgi:hypothetical protein